MDANNKAHFDVSRVARPRDEVDTGGDALPRCNPPIDFGRSLSNPRNDGAFWNDSNVVPWQETHGTAFAIA